MLGPELSTQRRAFHFVLTSNPWSQHPLNPHLQGGAPWLRRLGNVPQTSRRVRVTLRFAGTGRTHTHLPAELCRAQGPKAKSSSFTEKNTQAPSSRGPVRGGSPRATIFSPCTDTLPVREWGSGALGGVSFCEMPTELKTFASHGYSSDEEQLHEVSVDEDLEERV